MKRLSILPLLLIIAALFGSFFTMLSFTRQAFAAEDIVVTDTVIRGGIKVKKKLPLGNKEGDTVVKGTKFSIELASGNPVWVDGDDGERFYKVGEVITVIESGEDGVATTANDLLPYGTYTVKELEDGVNAGQRWDGWSDTVQVRVKNEIKATKDDTNELWLGTIAVQKYDSSLYTFGKKTAGTTEGDVKLDGIEFTVYNKSAAPIQYHKADGTLVTVAVDGVVDKIYTDVQGVATLPDDCLEYGTYQLVETNANTEHTGLLLGDTPWKSKLIQVHEDGKKVEYWSDMADGGAPGNEPVRGGVTVTKKLPLGKKQGDTEVKNTTFTVSLASGQPVLVDGDDGKKLYNVGDVIFTITTDENGVASTANNVLPFGTYIVAEKDVRDGQRFDSWSEPVKIRSANNEKLVSAGTDTNQMQRGSIAVDKRDAEMGSAQGDATLKGIEFTIYNRSAASIEYHKADGTVVTVEKDKAVDTIVTDDNGHAELPAESLDYGTYEVVESNANTTKTGYLPQSTAWSSGNIEVHKDKVTVKTECENEVLRGGAKIFKKDQERNVGVPQGDGNLAATYTIYNKSAKPIMVKGLTYDVDAAIMEVVTDPKTGIGTVALDVLPFGTYEVRETVPPTGYKLDTEWKFMFSVRATGVVYEETEEEKNANNVIRGGIEVYKHDYDTGTGTVQGDGNFNGIEITIYNASPNVINYKGTDIEPGAKVDTIVMTEGHAATGLTDLPYGTYLLKETKVPESTGYNLNPLWSPLVEVHKEGMYGVEIGTGDVKGPKITEPNYDDVN